MEKTKVFRRDNWQCRKCGRPARQKSAASSGLAVHHIRARADGGSDAVDNLIALCEGCHAEWHAVEVVSTYPFRDWLELPPWIFWLAFMTAPMPSEVSALEARARLAQLNRLRKEEPDFWFPEREEADRGTEIVRLQGKIIQTRGHS
jgi:hypothetical protein